MERSSFKACLSSRAISADFYGRHVPHGTRHTIATGLKEMGYPGEWIEMQLSHKLPGIQGVYTHAEHMASEQRPAMMQAWADRLFQANDTSEHA